MKSKIAILGIVFLTSSCGFFSKLVNPKSSVRDIRSAITQKDANSTFVPGQGETCDFENEIGVRIIDNTCVSCHKSGQPPRMDLSTAARKNWSQHGDEKILVLNRMIAGEMPPGGGLSEAVRNGAKACLEKLFPKADADECTKEAPSLPKDLWMATSVYFKASLLNAFGTSVVNFAQSDLDNFSNVQAGAQFSTHTTGGMFQAIAPVAQVATKIAFNYFLLQDRFSEIDVCAPNLTSSNPSLRDGCANQIFTVLHQKLIRGPMSAQTQSEIQAVYTNGLAAGNAKEGVAFGIYYLIQMPEMLYLYGPAASDPDKTLSQKEILVQMAKFLWSSPPDDALIATTGSLDLRNADTRAQVSLQMLQDNRAKTQVKNFYREQLLLNIAPAIPDDATYLDGVSRADTWNEAVAEFDWFIERNVFDQNATIYQLFTSNEAKEIGPNIAKIYGIQPYQQNAVVNVNGRNGILAKAANLIGAGQEVHYFHRGKMIATKLLCANIPPPDPNLIAANPGPSIAPDLPIRERSAMRTSSGVCDSCHKVLNAAASSSLIFDNLGRDRANGCEKVYSIDGSQILRTVCPPNAASKFTFDGKEYDVANLNQFGDLAGKSLSATQCFVDRFTTYAIGEPFKKPNTCFTRDVAKSVYPKNKSMKEILVEVIKSPEFIRRK